MMWSIFCSNLELVFRFDVKLIGEADLYKSCLGNRENRIEAHERGSVRKLRPIGYSLAALFVILVFEGKGSLGQDTAQFLLVFDFYMIISHKYLQAI
jgi:hypothetical protein